MYLLDLIQIMQEWLLGLMGDYTYGTLITNLILFCSRSWFSGCFINWFSVASGRSRGAY